MVHPKGRSKISMAPRELSYKGTIAAVLILASALSGCSYSVVYDEGSDPAFAECQSQCASRLTTFDGPSILCLIKDLRGTRRYISYFERVDEAVAATRLAKGSCGCLVAEISASGQLHNTEVRFSNSDSAVETVTEVVEAIQIPGNVDKCLVGAVVPFFFGQTHPNSSSLVHTVYPTRRFIVENELEEAAEIQLSSKVGWTYLNRNFGIVYSDDRRHLVELGCWGDLKRSNIKLDGITPTATLEAGKSRIDGCEILAFYQITSDEQELDLKRISLVPDPNPKPPQPTE